MNPYVVSRWDIGALRAAARRFVEAAESTRSWVLRGDAVRVTLAEPGAWDGVASEAGLADLAGWVEVAARAGPPLLALAHGVLDAVDWYWRAQDAAATALRTADGTGVSVSTDGTVTPGQQVDTTGLAPEQAAAALDRAAAAGVVQAELDRAAEAVARADALVRSDIGQFRVLGLPGFDAGSGFVDLTLAFGVSSVFAGGVIPVPVGSDPAAVTRWWSGLSLAQQLRLIDESPDLIGGLDGVSGWARDLANQALLEDYLRVHPDSEFAYAVAQSLAVLAGTGPPRQLYLFDPERELAAIAVGDVDTAEAVAVLVPGMNTTVADDMVVHVGNAARLWDATQTVDPNSSVAVLAWIGYDTPDVAQAAFDYHADWGAPALASTVAGVAARPGGGPRLTVVAHSYGTVTTAAAVEEPGRFAADAVVLVGSPGVTPHASDFEVPEEEVYIGEATYDLVGDFGLHGPDPGLTWFYGGTCIEADNQRLFGNGHTGYYDNTSTAFWNMAYIVQGHRSNVVRC